METISRTDVPPDDDRDPRDDDPHWLEQPWYRTTAGRATVLADVALTAILVLATAVRLDVDPATLAWLPTVVPAADLPHIPWFVYVFSLLGALGFVFTALIDDFRSSTMALFEYNLRLPAALPLGAGIYLLSGTLLGETNQSAPLVIGLVFLSGLYVNLAYKQLGALARRFLPDVVDRRNDDDSLARTGSRTTPAGENGSTADSTQDDGP